MARLTIEIRKNPRLEKVNGNDLVRSQKYDLILEAIKVISIYKRPRDISKPPVFSKIEFCLKNLTLYLSYVVLKECNQKSIEKIRNFLELYKYDWQIYAGNSRITYKSRKANIPEELPIESDVRTFWEFIISEIDRITKNITCGPIILSDVKDLAKFTLARIMTLNARRGGECSKLKLHHWETVEDWRWKRRTDVKNLKDPVEINLAETIELCYIEGKKKKKGSKNAFVSI